MSLLQIRCFICLLFLADISFAQDEDSGKKYLKHVASCLDNLIQYGTDRYGSLHTRMIMSIIDIRTNTSPRNPELLDGYVRTEGRSGRRNPGGADLWDDQYLIRTLMEYSSISGESKYSNAANYYIADYLEYSRLNSGLIAWGSHVFYNGYTDAVGDDGEQHHEILLGNPDWQSMWNVNSNAIKNEIELIWGLHVVDKSTGQHNRHDDVTVGCDFAFSGGSFAQAFAFLYKVSRDTKWLDRAKLIANWHWHNRNPNTCLTPDAPSTGSRFDAKHCFTTVPGPHAAALLECYKLTGDPLFYDIATSYIKAWIRYAWDEQNSSFYAAVSLDGVPVLTHIGSSKYDSWMPVDHLDTWPAILYSYEFCLFASQTCIDAWQFRHDPELLSGAKKWAIHIRKSLPPSVGNRWKSEFSNALHISYPSGAYADGYGRAILFFIGLYGATHDTMDLRTAVDVADLAISQLASHGWLRGHPDKPYYESTDGVGILMYSFLKLHAVLHTSPLRN